jgi:hypothetical protein
MLPYPLEKTALRRIMTFLEYQIEIKGELKMNFAFFVAHHELN